MLLFQFPVDGRTERGPTPVGKFSVHGRKLYLKIFPFLLLCVFLSASLFFSKECALHAVEEAKTTFTTFIRHSRAGHNPHQLSNAAPSFPYLEEASETPTQLQGAAGAPLAQLRQRGKWGPRGGSGDDGVDNPRGSLSCG